MDYLNNNVQPVLKPLLVRAAVEQPKRFHAWLIEQLEKEVAPKAEVEEDSRVESKRGHFTAKIAALLTRVQTKQEKLTAEDLKAVATWLDEDAAQIDDLIVEDSGQRQEIHTP